MLFFPEYRVQMFMRFFSSHLQVNGGHAYKWENFTKIAQSHKQMQSVCIQHKINTTKKLIKLILNSAFNFSRILKISFCYCHNIFKNDLKVLKFLLLKVALLLSRCACRKKICFANSSFLSSYIYGIFNPSKNIKLKSHKCST